MNQSISKKATSTPGLLRQLGVAIAISLLLFVVIAASIYLANQQETASTGGSRARIAGDRAYQRQDWDAAVEHYSEVLQRDPFNPMAMFRRAYALHSVFYESLDQTPPGAPPSAAHGRLAQQALGAYQETLDHLAWRQVAYYNIGCIHARLGQTDEALAAVQRSIELGMAGGRFASDSDFDSIRDDPRFQELTGQRPEPSAAGQGLSIGVR